MELVKCVKVISLFHTSIPLSSPPNRTRIIGNDVS